MKNKKVTLSNLTLSSFLKCRLGCYTASLPSGLKSWMLNEKVESLNLLNASFSELNEFVKKGLFHENSKEVLKNQFHIYLQKSITIPGRDDIFFLIAHQAKDCFSFAFFILLSFCVSHESMLLCVFFCRPFKLRKKR